MADALGYLATAAALAAILGGFVWLARWFRRHGIGGGVMGVADELYNPGAHRFRQEVQIQEQRMAPAPSADDLLRRNRSRRLRPR